MYSASTLATLSRCRRLSGRLGLALFVGLVCLGSPAIATTRIVDTDGFETGFSAGALAGQSGWAVSGGGVGSATVQGTTVESGSQAVQVVRGALSDDRWAMPVTGQGFPGHRYIFVDWDMNVTGTGAAAGVFGPFLGVDTYRAPSGFSVLGSLGVDATTGDVLYQQTNSGFLAESGSTINFGQWNHFQIRLDFQQDEYSIYLNDNFLLSTGFVDGPASTFTDADIAAFAAAGDALSQNQTATAYFDNFLVRDISPADYDIDGDVDAADLATWRNAYGTSAAGDADLDGDSDGADFLILQRDFDGAAPLSAVASVPEPTTLTLAFVALLLCQRRHR